MNDTFNSLENTQNQEPAFDPIKTDAVMPEDFVDRQRHEYLKNRKMIKVLSQSAGEMEAEIIDYPFQAGETMGTAVNANLMQSVKSVLSQADTNAKNAYLKSDYAKQKSEQVAEQTATSLTQMHERIEGISNTTQAAVATANTAKTASDTTSSQMVDLQTEFDALKRIVADEKGTVVFVDGQPVETFEASELVYKTTTDTLETVKADKSVVDGLAQSKAEKTELDAVKAMLPGFVTTATDQAVSGYKNFVHGSGVGIGTNWIVRKNSSGDLEFIYN